MSKYEKDLIAAASNGNINEVQAAPTPNFEQTLRFRFGDL
jgi:hypothetical protein